MSEEVGGDSIQPGAGVGPFAVIGLPSLEGHAEDLTEQQIRLVAAHPSRQVAEKHRGMTIEQSTEAFRIADRRPVTGAHLSPPGTRLAVSK